MNKTFVNFGAKARIKRRPYEKSVIGTTGRRMCATTRADACIALPRYLSLVVTVGERRTRDEIAARPEPVRFVRSGRGEKYENDKK